MEFRPVRRSDNPNKTPPKGGQPSLSDPIERTTPSAKANKDTRTFYGFDDIPVDDDNMDDVRFVDILKAWVKRGIQHSPLEKGAERAGEQKKRLNELKNDLKWAMQADLDEAVKPSPKQPKQPTPPQAPPQQSGQQAAHTPTPDASKTIDINISFGALPKIPSGKNTFKRLFARIKSFRLNRLAVKALGALVIVVLSAGAWFFVPASPGALSNNRKNESESSTKNTPQYSTVLPDGKSVESLGGWKRVSPNDRDPVYAYADKIDDVPVTISQQPLPADFKTDTSNKVAELAKAYGATNKIESGAQTIYIGSSEQGPQSAIVIKDGTLILMKSTQKIPDEAWASYVKSLH